MVNIIIRGGAYRLDRRELPSVPQNDANAPITNGAHVPGSGTTEKDVMVAVALGG